MIIVYPIVRYNFYIMAKKHAILPAIFVASLSSLSFEIVLTRIFAISLWYHFAFMVISIAMLGIGASGTLLSSVDYDAFGNDLDDAAVPSPYTPSSTTPGKVIDGQELRDRGVTDLLSALTLATGVDVAPGGDGAATADAMHRSAPSESRTSTNCRIQRASRSAPAAAPGFPAQPAKASAPSSATESQTRMSPVESRPLPRSTHNSVSTVSPCS